MSATTKDKLEFVHAMARHTQATVRQCEALMRYAATLQRLAEDDCNVATDDERLAKREQKRTRIRLKVMDICSIMTADMAIAVKSTKAIEPVFSGDPRGAVLKIRVPDSYTNDFGGEGIAVPS